MNDEKEINELKSFLSKNFGCSGILVREITIIHTVMSPQKIKRFSENEGYNSQVLSPKTTIRSI